MPNRPHFTYANIVSTLALFLALSGGAAFAAGKIHSGDIAAKAVKSANLAPGAVHTSNLFKRAITSGKLALGAVHGNQIVDGGVGAKQVADGAIGNKQVADKSISAKQVADGAIGAKQVADKSISAKQIADGAIGSTQIGAAAVAPSNLQFPVFYAASPSGGSAAITEAPSAYPLADASWTQTPGEIEVLFGGAWATVAYDESSGEGSCQVSFEISINGQQVGGGQISTSSTTSEQLETSLGAQPQIDPLVAVTNHLTMRTGSNGGCTTGSTIDSTRFRVLDFG
jgi:hypothetical protein